MDNSQGALLNDINIYVTLIYIYHEIKVNFKIPWLFPLCHRRRPRTLRESLPMTDAADRLFSHVNVGSSFLMAIFMTKHCAARRNG